MIKFFFLSEHELDLDRQAVNAFSECLVHVVQSGDPRRVLLRCDDDFWGRHGFKTQPDVLQVLGFEAVMISVGYRRKSLAERLQVHLHLLGRCYAGQK